MKKIMFALLTLVCVTVGFSQEIPTDTVPKRSSDFVIDDHSINYSLSSDGDVIVIRSSVPIDSVTLSNSRGEVDVARKPVQNLSFYSISITVGYLKDTIYTVRVNKYPPVNLQVVKQTNSG